MNATSTIMYPRTFFLYAFFAVLAVTLSAFASPVPGNSTEVLDKRVTHTGRGTWFHPGLGHCGKRNSDGDAVVAIGIGRYGSGTNCDQWVQITNVANGRSAYGLTRDSCQSCSTEDLDMSPSLFQRLAPLSQGVMRISWQFKARGFSPRDVEDEIEGETDD